VLGEVERPLSSDAVQEEADPEENANIDNDLIEDPFLRRLRHVRNEGTSLDENEHVLQLIVA
jgi:hypothetical protein